MLRATGSPPDTPSRTLVRPTSTTARLRGRLARLRLGWRRLAVAAGAGLSAAILTVVWLSSAPAEPDEVSTSNTGDTPPEEPATAEPDPSAQHENRIGADQRIVALERSTVEVPVTIGSVVEVIGLRPTVTDVQAEVIAPRAQVVGLTDDAVMVVLDVEAAHLAVELASEGRVAILGRERPPAG